MISSLGAAACSISIRKHSDSRLLLLTAKQQAALGTGESDHV